MNGSGAKTAACIGLRRHRQSLFGQVENLARADPTHWLSLQSQYHLHTRGRALAGFLPPPPGPPARQQLGRDDHKSIEAYIALVRNETVPMVGQGGV